VEELLEKAPETPDNKEILIGAVQNGNIVLNKEAKKLLQDAVRKWKLYGESLQSYFIRGFFVIALATIFTLFCIYLWGAAFNVYELIPPLKPYGSALFIGFFFLPGYFAGIWILNSLLDLPETPAEKIKTVIRRVEEEERRTNLESESSSTDTISLGAAGVEPYSTIYGFRHDDMMIKLLSKITSGNNLITLILYVLMTILVLAFAYMLIAISRLPDEKN
jgi:hypothetical protein